MARPLKKRSALEILKIVTAIRRRNNIVWMEFPKALLKAKPRIAKRIIRKIIENDRKISLWMSRI